MKKLFLLLVIILVAAGGFLGVRLWRNRVAEAQEVRAFARAESLLGARRMAEASALVQAFASRPKSRMPWSDLDFRILVAQMNLPRLTSLFHQDPNRILANEDASLTVARAFLHLRQPPEFERVRTAWRGRETDSGRWLLLDADRILLDGSSSRAEELLRSTNYAGTNDIPRLLRLALLTAAKKPQESVEFLNRAAALDPRQPDTRSFRAQVLEALGRPADARVEYVAAVVAEPGNPIWRDQLAEFYRRRGSHDLALKTWTESFGASAFDAMWLKTAFWGRMVAPVDFAGITNRPPNGGLSPLYQFVRDLPQGRFFDTNLFESLPGHRRHAQDRQEVYWLRVAELLARGQESAAYDLLTAPRAPGGSWEPHLDRALLRILAWRTSTNHSLIPRGVPLARIGRPNTNLHSFFVTLEQQAVAEETRTSQSPDNGPELEAFLASKQAFAGAFLAAGWREAALQLAGDTPPAPNAPTWYTYGLAQALRYNRGHAAALSFLARHRGNPVLQLLEAEILLADGKAAEGRKGLLTLTALDSDVGMRASWILATDALEQRRFDDARALVRNSPVLSKHVSGQELLARAALSQGDTNTAMTVYSAISKQSAEAQMFLARQAFAARDWDRAQSLTLSLLELMPDELALRSNLQKIAAARGAP